MNESLPKQVLHTIRSKKLLAAGDHVIVACSGGADSVALLSVMSELRDELGISLSAFHLNHMLRGEEADRDQRLTEEICEALRIPCRVERIPVEESRRAWGISFEEAGRVVRYRTLDRYREEIEGQEGRRALIATAHHRGDVAETFVLNLLRGSGSDGLASIAYQAGAVIRPFLAVTRASIETYLDERGIDWCEDSTNASLDHRRNRIRNRWLPMLAAEAEVDPIDSIFRTTELLKEERAFWEEHIEQLRQERVRAAQDSRRIRNPEDLHPAVYRRLIRRCLAELLGSLKDVTAQDVEAIVRLEQVGSGVGLRKGIRALRRYDGLEITLAPTERPTSTPEADESPGELDIVEFRMDTAEAREALELSKRDPHCALVDADKLSGTLHVRRRRPGDRFIPHGMTGHKSLKKFLIDCKVERDERERLRIVTDDEKIIWVEGLRTSESVRVDRNTKRALLLRFGTLFKT